MKELRWFLRSKIHLAHVTEANLDYVGSITIDLALMEACGLEEGEKVLVVSRTSGSRLETYVIPGEKESGVICMNGAAAHLIKKDEVIIIMGFALAEGTLDAKVIHVNDQNEITD